MSLKGCMEQVVAKHLREGADGALKRVLIAEAVPLLGSAHLPS